MPEVKIQENGKNIVVPAEQVWRTPFICGFKAGWSRFMLASVHILWGGGKAEPANRVKEINAVAEFLKKGQKRETETGTGPVVDKVESVVKLSRCLEQHESPRGEWFTT